MVAGLFHVSKDACFQFAYVLGTRCVLDRVLLLEHSKIAAFFKQLVKQQIRRIVFGIRAQRLDHVGKLAHFQRAAAKFGKAVSSLENVKERRVVFVGKIKRRFHALGADAARRIVDDARQTQIVPRNSDHA